MRSIVINPSICLCVYVCLSMDISLEPLDRSSRNFVCRSPVAVARSSSGGVAILCTSGFMNNVTFGRNGRDTETWQLHDHCEATTTRGIVIPGRSLMSMNASLVSVTKLRI